MEKKLYFYMIKEKDKKTGPSQYNHGHNDQIKIIHIRW